MSERPPQSGEEPPLARTPEGSERLQAIIMPKEEYELWEGVARILDEPVAVVYRLCALSGAEHYLAELGQMEQAAMAGALLRLHAERRGIEVQAHEPSTRQVKMGRSRKERRAGGKRKEPR